MSVKNTISITEARKRIFEIAEEAQKPDNYYTLTEKGKPKVVLMSAEEFDSIMETVDILSDPDILNNIKQAEEEYRNGEYKTWDELKKEFGIGKKEPLMVCEKAKKKYHAK